MSSTVTIGRLGNQCFRNLAASLFAEKHNLYIVYNNNLEFLGFKLFCGKKKYITTIEVNDSNYLDLYEKESIDFNCKFASYFQSTKIALKIHEYLKSKIDTIVSNNKYNKNYNNNNDCFIHVRLGDVAKFNPGFNYYDKILTNLQADKIYISTDDSNHKIIHELFDKYKNIKLIDYSLEDAILFGSTNKYVVLSHGTFSGIIGYLSFYSNVYFVKENSETSWDYFDGNGLFDIFKDHCTAIGKFNEIGKDV